jgi:hypothetical protein
MALIAAIALQYWKPIAIALGIAAVLAYGSVMRHRLASAQAGLNAAQAQLDAYKSANAACEAEVARQNAAVDGIQSDAEAAARAAASRQANLAASASRAAAADVARADSEIQQSQVGPSCDDAIRWAAGRAQELSRWND